MGFLNTSVSFTRFRILDPVPDSTIANALESLKRRAFRDIDDLPEIRSFGWVSFDDPLDLDFAAGPPQKGAYLAFSLRLDTRRVSPAVIKKHLAKALKSEKEKFPEKKYVSRERKKELKESVTSRLLNQAQPIPADFNVIWNTADNAVWFASVNAKMIDLFMELFRDTFNLVLEPVTPFVMAETIVGESESDRLATLERASFTPR